MEKLQITLRDIKILTLLNLGEKNTPYKASSFDEILEIYLASSSSKHNPANSTIRRSIKSLLDSKCISYGFKRGNVKTYYINDVGIKLLSEIKE